MVDNRGWLHCPICRSKTKTKVNKDTQMHNFPLFCPKCKQESKIDVENMQMKLTDEYNRYKRIGKQDATAL